MEKVTAPHKLDSTSSYEYLFNHLISLAAFMPSVDLWHKVTSINGSATNLLIELVKVQHKPKMQEYSPHMMFAPYLTLQQNQLHWCFAQRLHLPNIILTKSPLPSARIGTKDENT